MQAAVSAGSSHSRVVHDGPEELAAAFRRVDRGEMAQATELVVETYFVRKAPS